MIKQNWKPEELRQSALEIRGSVMPKSITPEMVGGTLEGLVDAVCDLAAHRVETGIYPFAGFMAGAGDESDDNNDFLPGSVVFDTEGGCFLELGEGEVWRAAGDPYNECGPEGPPRADAGHLFRLGASLYRAGEDKDGKIFLLRLADVGDLTGDGGACCCAPIPAEEVENLCDGVFPGEASAASPIGREEVRLMWEETLPYRGDAGAEPAQDSDMPDEDIAAEP